MHFHLELPWLNFVISEALACLLFVASFLHQFASFVSSNRLP